MGTIKKTKKIMISYFYWFLSVFERY